MTKIAIVFGASGASGKALCLKLLKEEKISKLIAVTRKPLNFPSNKKLHVLKLSEEELFSLESFLPLVKSSIDLAFCCLGTTRKKSKSAKLFKKIDFELPLKLAQVIKKDKVPHFSLISAKGANPSIWALDLALFHPLLYTKTKGELERELIKLNFSCLHIFRPGLLNRRQEDSRFFESLALKLIPSLNVDKLATFMIRKSLDRDNQKKIKRVMIFEDKDILPR